MKNSYALIILLLLLISVPVIAQDIDEEEENGAFTFSGSADVYFRKNFNGPSKGEFAQSPVTSFGNLPGFSLGMFNLKSTYQGKNVGVVADLVFGPRGEDAVFRSPMNTGGFGGSSQIINQLYVYWTASDAVTLTFGNFNTYLGYEVISPTGNFNYSTSYMFSYGPFSHTGIKADFTLSEKFSLMTALMNPTDMTEFNELESYSIGAQLGYTSGKGSTYLNFLYGDQDGTFDLDFPLNIGEVSAGKTFQVDLTTGFDLTDKFYLGFNTTYNTISTGEIVTPTNDVEDVSGDASGFYGAAIYLQSQLSEKLKIGARGEYFSVFNTGIDGAVGLDDAGDGNVFALTLTGNVKVSRYLTLIPELRVDTTSEATFLNNSLDPSKNLSSFLLAAVFSF
ncbi:Putative beta-barrel porin-2, OmpL-like. bbp2 [Aquiflexum balticum DSM 16537]|uniref:Putative beta-barrel porin-2, OmpL-like. bbp2 n=1 Tax=Aquiflexum balticum DSM 16537 TaxID=758820 RepID=A0A1W2H4R8_9BACT|nr:porin [Aquiflexum balticum]SMD43456.1 Putative beta-barrel porin-2, OmpL-like. bbp2 [Aquiflexum balticum DSM 16537]